MEEIKHSSINTNDNELNVLFRELLEGLRDDLEEAKDAVMMYKDAMDENKESGKITYGQFYNDALKIKGAARDRQLKFGNMFKDRVSTKEKISLVKKEETFGALPSQSEMTKFIEEMEKNKLPRNIIVEPNINYSSIDANQNVVEDELDYSYDYDHLDELEDDNDE